MNEKPSFRSRADLGQGIRHGSVHSRRFLSVKHGPLNANYWLHGTTIVEAQEDRRAV